MAGDTIRAAADPKRQMSKLKFKKRLDWLAFLGTLKKDLSERQLCLRDSARADRSLEAFSNGLRLAV